MGFFYENGDDDMYDYIPGEYVYPEGTYVPEEYMDEKWWYTDIPGYMVSNYGRVWSEKKQQFLKVKRLDREGHMGVCLCHKGKQHYFYIHRLMAKAFIPNPHNLPYVRHLNDIPDDNELYNFAWGTQSDNIKDALRNGRTYTASPEVRDRALDSVRIPIIATELSTGKKRHFRSQADASNILHVQRANIWKVLNGERRQAGGYYFEYAERGNANV